MNFLKTRHLFACTLLLCATVLWIPPHVTAQVVNIPDPGLRAVIAKALNKAPDTAITRADMATLKRLVGNNKDIRDLTGVEFATHLEYLNLRRNLIADITPVAELTQLRALYLQQNRISNISPIAELINLTHFNIGDNLVSDLSPIASLVNLGVLWVYNNKISDISPLAGLVNLRRFQSWGRGNPIADLSAFAGLAKLEFIGIRGGAVSDLGPLAGLTRVTELDFRDNAISDVSPLAGLSNLERLNLERNTVSEISSLARLSNLKWLNLHANVVSDVSPLAGLRNLEWLNLRDNAVSDISPLAGLSNLKSALLDYNLIVDISPLARLAESVPISWNNNPGFPVGGPKIEGPWLWALIPGTRLGTTDFLAQASNGAVTEQKVATNGATEGKRVGKSVWRAHTLSPTGGDNLNEMTDSLGWGRREEIYDHIVYGSVSLESPRLQNTRMFVGSDDAVKVWLNGALVHQALFARAASDYHDFFPVTLKRGTNVLLVAVDNRGHGAFSGFFGFAPDAEYTVNPPAVLNTPAWDVNQDGQVSVLDLILVAQKVGKAVSANARTDVNGDGTHSILDLVLVAQHLGETTDIAAPVVVAMDSKISPPMIATWIVLARTASDGSAAFERGISNLERLLASLIPEKTALLANYPNPFNPETWIPYQLATDAEVQLRIYAMDGKLVRTFQLGHQAAGIYQHRERAAYWDGKNEVGEPVASGVYFYTLTAGGFTATRKMLIRK